MGIGVLAWIFHASGSGFKSFLVSLYKFSWFLIWCDWIFCFIIRFQDSGEQCSGDNMVLKRDSNKYLYVQGIFMYFAGLIVAFIFIMYMLNSCISMCRGKSGVRRMRGDGTEMGKVSRFE